MQTILTWPAMQSQLAAQQHMSPLQVSAVPQSGLLYQQNTAQLQQPGPVPHFQSMQVAAVDPAALQEFVLLWGLDSRVQEFLRRVPAVVRDHVLQNFDGNNLAMDFSMEDSSVWG